MKNKCICCKFDNCKSDFVKHRSHTSFSALDRQFTVVADLVRHPEKYIEKVCDKHIGSMVEWLEGVFKYRDTLSGGVMLPKITRR